VGKMVRFIAVSSIAGGISFGDTITVRVHNVAGAAAAVIAGGEREATRTLKSVGIEVQWADCPPPDLHGSGNETCNETYKSSRFTVVVAEGFANAPIKDTALGFALPFLADRNHAAVVYPRIRLLATRNSDFMDCSSLLGMVLAHEIAHLLFGSMSHGGGIMQADWTREDFKRIGQRRFSFSPEQGAGLRAGLRSRHSASPGEYGSDATRNLAATQKIGIAD
jgi:hypothetical protein